MPRIRQITPGVTQLKRKKRVAAYARVSEECKVLLHARVISNVLNKIVRENQQMGLLMISHCRIFPFITRELKLTSEGIIELPNSYVCHSCFGEPDEKGFYSI